MENEPTDSPVRFWVIYLAILGTILFIGWKQPLRYRFMSTAEIWAMEHPSEPLPLPPGSTPFPTPKPTPTPSTPSWLWDRTRKNPLDNQPYVR